MRTYITVRDLTPRQWQHVATRVPVDGETPLAGVPLMCVVFIDGTGSQELHVEMDHVKFMITMLRLHSMRDEVIVVAQAALTPDHLGESW